MNGTVISAAEDLGTSLRYIRPLHNSVYSSKMYESESEVCCSWLKRALFIYAFERQGVNQDFSSAVSDHGGDVSNALDTVKYALNTRVEETGTP